MSIRHMLQEFSSGSSYHHADPANRNPEEDLEEFENGYKAGWDDAVAAQREDHSRISTELARNLQDLAFTYQEAHSAMVREVKPLFAEMVGVVLPEFAKKTLAPMVAEQLAQLAEGMGEVSAELRVSAGDRDKLEELIDADFGFPVRCKEDNELIEGQVFLSLGDREREINLSEALRSMSLVVEGYFEELGKDQKNVRE